MTSLDSPEIAAAYDAVRSESDETNWLLLSYAAPTGEAMTLTATGSGGIDELKTHLQDDQAQFAYLRIEYANDSESTRVKFALVIWIGEYTKVMRKARVGFQSGEVKKVLRHYSVQIDVGDKADLDEKEVVIKCRKAGGADYNGGRG